MRISTHCYAVTGLAWLPPWTVNAGFVVGAHTTLVVDTGGNRLAGQTVLGYATLARLANRLLLLNTERHLDHVGGNCVFAEANVPIYGHRDIRRRPHELHETAAELDVCIPNQVRRGQGEGREFVQETTVVNPTVPLQADLAFDLGQLEVLVLMVPGHTSTNLALWVPGERVVYLGDCVVAGYLPNLEDGTREDWEQWLDSLERIASLRAAYGVPGHGQVLDGPQLEREIVRHRRVIQRAITDGHPPTVVPSARA